INTIQHYIELTRFPVPNDEEHRGTSDYPGLIRAADLIGQLADPRYITTVLFLIKILRLLEMTQSDF
ncbi:MAG: hypothetical protein RLZZ115_2469, partial [Cyanobacteriota bacterium]